MTVFIVHGTSGEYSDRSEWIVAGYLKDADAKAHVEQAEQYAKVWCAKHNYIEPHPNPFDEQACASYTGISYWYEEIEIKDKFTTPEVLQ